MDVCLICIEPQENEFKFTFCGAKRPLIIFKDIHNMEQEQQKCLLASLGGHLMLFGAFVLGSAFISQTPVEELPKFRVIPSIVIDEMLAGGGGNPNLTQTDPAPAGAPPAGGASHSWAGWYRTRCGCSRCGCRGRRRRAPPATRRCLAGFPSKSAQAHATPATPSATSGRALNPHAGGRIPWHPL